MIIKKMNILTKYKLDLNYQMMLTERAMYAIPNCLKGLDFIQEVF